MPEVRKAVVFTAYNRIGYLTKVLDSWRNVRGIRDWVFYASIDPSPHTNEVVDLFAQFFRDTGTSLGLTNVNKERLGVLHHPWVALDHVFSHGNDFAVRVEDDLMVSDDFLEYMDYARQEFEDDKDIAAVIGYTNGPDGDESEVWIRPEYGPWNWGTWKDRWDEYIGPTWDHDYSTYNGTPGNQSGWDWNLNTRVLPSLGKSCVFPGHSRVQNIGAQGTHAQPANFPQSPSYREHFGEQKYHLGR